MTPCKNQHRLSLCEKPEGHAGFHKNGSLTWGFRDEDDHLPEWVRRAKAHALVAKDMTGGAA